MRSLNRHRRSTALLIVAAVVLSSCGGAADPPASSGITVVATTTILGDVAINIVGDHGSVETLLPVGASPHDYQASAQQAAAVQSADLVIANGLSLEEGLADLLESAEGDGANILTIAPLLDPIPFASDALDAHGDGDEDHSGDDPHVWLDPLRMAAAGHLIAEQLSGIDASIDWESRAQAYATELLAADRQIVAILDSIPASDRKLVTNHGSFGYFAQRYQFEVIGVVIPGGSTLADPSSAELTGLVEEMSRRGVTAIFGDTTESSALAEAIADESVASVQVVELYTGSLGGPGSGAETLIDLLISNARLIANALGG